jgi:thioredoxin reductase (NADPH)
VARDLRRRYGIGTGSCGPSPAADGLDALRQMKLRGDLVAAIMADYRMPGQNGIDFLEQAMEICPGGPAGAADRVRRYRGGDRRDQRG